MLGTISQISKISLKLLLTRLLLNRGNIDEYPRGSFLSLEALEAEIKSDEVVGVVPMPGWLLAEGVEATHAGDPISGWMQYGKFGALGNQLIEHAFSRTLFSATYIVVFVSLVFPKQTKGSDKTIRYILPRSLMLPVNPWIPIVSIVS